MTRQLTDAPKFLHEELPEPFRTGIGEILAEPTPDVNLARLQSGLTTSAKDDINSPIWRLRMAQFAWVAAVVAIVLVAIPKLTPTSNVWAQAIQQVANARSLTYTQLLSVKGRTEPVKVRYFVAADGRMRSEQSGITTIFGADRMIRITLIEQSKTAIVANARKSVVDKPATANFIGWMDALKQAGDKPDKELGQKDLDGKKVTGFVATQGNFTFTMWIDTVTGNPVRLEYEPNVKGAGYEAVVMTDLSFDQKLDDSLFDDAVPDGYQVMARPQQPGLPLATLTNGEENVVKALQGYTKRSGGTFPSSITDWGPWAVLFSKPLPDGTADPDTQTVMSHLGAITPFLSGISKENYAYLGNGKTTKETDTIVFWYKQKNGTYRAVYGDFSAKDLAEEHIPKE